MKEMMDGAVLGHRVRLQQSGVEVPVWAIITKDLRS